MDIIYLIEDSVSKLKYLGSKKNWKGDNTYWGSPSIKFKNHKKFKLQNEWKKNFNDHKESFSLKILESYENITQQELLNRERFFQIKYDVLHNDEFINANLAGGRGFIGKGNQNPMYGKKHSPESIQKMKIKQKELGIEKSAKTKGKNKEELWGKETAKAAKIKLSNFAKNRKGNKNPFFGKHHKPETIQKIKQKQKGNKPINTKKIFIDEQVYNGLNDAELKTGIKASTIWYRIHSKNIKFKNYYYL